MKEIILSYGKIFKSNKTITACIFLVQIIGCVLLLLISTFFATLSYRNAVNIYKSGGMRFSDYESGITEIQKDESVANVIVRLENEVYATARQISTCNFNKVYDLSVADRIIILNKNSRDEFSVGDTVELFGADYRIVDFSTSGISEIPLLSLPDNTEILNLELTLNANPREKKLLVKKANALFAGCNVVASSDNVMLQLLKSDTVLFILIVAVLLLIALTLLLCYKYYFDKIRRINDLCFTVGIRLTQLRFAMTLMFALISLIIFALASGIYYIVGAAMFANIENAFGTVIYRLKFGDAAINFLLYLATVLLITTFYFASKKRYKGARKFYD